MQLQHRIQSPVIFAAALLVSLLSPAMALDTEKYIPFDEIRPGMDAYCLTVYDGTKIEKFDLEVLDVMYRFRPGQNRIVVKGLDPRFIHSGPVQGCSGSPVFIDGRMAGALSSGWGFSKDPLYMATPIEEMLSILDATEQSARSGMTNQPRLALDFSKPLNFSNLKRQYRELIHTPSAARGQSLCPLVTSLPPAAIEQLRASFQGLGFEILQNASTGSAKIQPDLAQIKPGGVLAVPLMDGDISMAATGTITDVIPAPDGDRILAFGHGFNSEGPVDMPIALGTVHTIVASNAISFKLSSSTTPIGTLTHDQDSGVVGVVGKTPKTIDFNLSIDSFADAKIRDYNCKMAVHRRYTPLLLRSAIMAATMRTAEPPYEHTFKYSVDFEFEKYPPLHFENVSSQLGFAQILEETGLVMMLLLNNPYEIVDVKKISVDIKLIPETTAVEINRISISSTTAKPGDRVTVDALLDTFRGEKINRTFDITIPDDTQPGTYMLTFGGFFTYENIFQQNKRHLIAPYDVPSLLKSLELFSGIKRDKVYLVMNRTTGGVALRNRELPSLPATKTLLLSDPKHTDIAQPYKDWTEKVFPVDFILMDEYQFQIKVENSQK